MSENEDQDQVGFWGRFWLYILNRLGEPTSWAGISVACTAVGVNISPANWQIITTIGLSIVSALLFAAREGRNKPDNPTLPSTVKGELPPQKPAIVPPPAPAQVVAIDPQRVPVDAAGELQAPQQEKKP